MSTIKEIKDMIRNNRVLDAIKSASALAEKHDLDDLVNSFIGLQARQTAVMEDDMEGLMDPGEKSREKARIRKSLNFFLDKMEEEIPEEDIMTPDQAKQEEINSLEKKISFITRKLTFLRDEESTNSDPSTLFNIKEEISNLEKDLEGHRNKLNELSA